VEDSKIVKNSVKIKLKDFDLTDVVRSVIKNTLVNIV
jgi:hypothetical protein